MFSVKNLKIIFNFGIFIEICVLCGLLLDILVGQFVIVIGFNGVGKLIFFNVVFGDLLIDSGQILIDDEDVICKLVWVCVNCVVWVFQDFMVGICEDFIIEENMVLVQCCGVGCGFGRVVQVSMCDGFWESLVIFGFGLENCFGDCIGLFFGGQCQVVSLLMVVLQLLCILLFDEYIVVFDLCIVDFVLYFIVWIVVEKKFIIMMVIYSMCQVLDVGECMVMLYQGQVVLDVFGE